MSFSQEEWDNLIDELYPQFKISKEKTKKYHEEKLLDKNEAEEYACMQRYS